MVRFSSIRAVVFDLDGLMADSEPLAEWAWAQVLARHGHTLDQETFRRMLGMRVADSARFVCQTFSLPIDPQDALAERDKLFLDAVPSRLQACPGLYGLLGALDRRGVPLGVATSGHRQYVALAFRTLGLEGRFRALVTGDDVIWGKPAPDIYLLAAERLGIPSICCLALEDAPLGAESARAAGMDCVVVPNRWTAELSFPGACRRFSSLQAVEEALDELLASGRCAAPEEHVTWYVAAGGVVVRGERVLVLRRPKRGEVRLPKGHVEPGEEVQAAAVREVREESGYADLVLKADLGARLVEFERDGRHVARTERYFLMVPADEAASPAAGEGQFEPLWLAWDEALAALTFEPEREWLRRARSLIQDMEVH